MTQKGTIFNNIPGKFIFLIFDPFCSVLVAYKNQSILENLAHYFVGFFSARQIRFSAGLMKPHCLQNLPSRCLHKFNVWGLGSNSATLVSTSLYASVKKLEKQEAKLIPEVIPFTEVD